MHLLWYTWNWSTEPQVYINCHDQVPPLVWLHLSTWRYMTSHVVRPPTPSPTVYAVHCGCVWNLYTNPGWEILSHERQQGLATLKAIKRWWKIKANGMHSFPFQTKLCPQKCLNFADMNLRKFLFSHQIAVLFYWTLGDTHEQLDKNIVPSSQSHCLMLKMWIQVTEERLNCDSTAEPFCAKTASKEIFWFSKSDKDAIYLP